MYYCQSVHYCGVCRAVFIWDLVSFDSGYSSKSVPSSLHRYRTAPVNSKTIDSCPLQTLKWLDFEYLKANTKHKDKIPLFTTLYWCWTIDLSNTFLQMRYGIELMNPSSAHDT